MTTPEELDALQERLRFFSVCWGDEPSIAPHSKRHPGITTGSVISAANAADAAITALRARVAEMEAFIENDADWKFSAKRRLTLFREQRARAERAEARVAELEDRAEAAEAELARRGQGVQVNLVWEDLDGYAWRATAPLFGSFRVERYSNGPWQALWSVPGYCAAFVDGGFATAEDAKQAIEARIRAALVSPGDGWRNDPAKEFDKADWFWRTMDPDDCGDSPEEAINRAMVGHFCVCEIASSYSGPTRYGFIAPVLDPDSDDEEFVHFSTQEEAIAAAKARSAPPASEPSEYEKKVAQMKEDFPNGI